MKSLFFVFAWFLLSAGVIVTTIAGYSFYKDNIVAYLENDSYDENVAISIGQANGNSEEILGATTIVETEDARALIITNFLKRYNGETRNLHHPLVPEEYFGKFFVELADKYNLDFRLLPAIAMQESNLCVKTPKPTDENGNIIESFNCLGFGVYGQTVTKFSSFEANFEQAAKTLKKNYIDIGLDTPYKIMKKYTPPSNGSWADSINQWMAEMRYDDRKSGIKNKEEADLLEFVDASDSALESAKDSALESAKDSALESATYSISN
ncbi:MAG: glucosaminidase domain-containing protein [Pseudomonadales bacterium]|nr:glucosaminidase domain-containing protein [Pseudomonadales bacterium]